MSIDSYFFNLHHSFLLTLFFYEQVHWIITRFVHKWIVSLAFMHGYKSFGQLSLIQKHSWVLHDSPHIISCLLEIWILDSNSSYYPFLQPNLWQTFLLSQPRLFFDFRPPCQKLVCSFDHERICISVVTFAGNFVTANSIVYNCITLRALTMDLL